ncbi:MAG: ribosome-associated translation inhibitor RaiA [Acidimicrobiales bacterium]
MQINVSARHTEITKGDRDLIIEKIARLGGKFLEMDRAEVHFFEERNPRIHDKEVCEITLEGHGHHIRCKSNGPDHITAVDRAIEKLENKLHKLKTKLSTYRTHRDVTRAKMWATASTEIADDLVADLAAANGVSTNGAVATAGYSDGLTDADLGIASPEAEVLVDSYRIVKTKTVENLPLTPIDAAMRMDLVGHAFYFFTNVETGGPAVVYRREDGDIGLILS